MPPSRGRFVLCICSRCLRSDPGGRLIPSSDRRQHIDRDIGRELRGPSRQNLGQGLHNDEEDRSDNDGGQASRNADAANSLSGSDRIAGQGSDPMRRDGGEGQDPDAANPAEGNGDGVDPLPVAPIRVQSESENLPWLRLFMILLLWLSCARGLSRSCARIILSFLTDLLLPTYGISAPRQVSTVSRQLGHRQSMTKFAICPNYDCQACWRLSVAPDSCNHCGAVVLIPESKGRPYRYFHYDSVIDFLQDCFQDPDFETNLNAWRTRPHTATLSDVYDGTAWNSDGFLVSRLNIYLSIGVDWFVPYTFGNTASYTIGAVSVRIENLPPALRNQPEYMHSALILPGPRQTSDAGLVAAMRPLIEDLNRLYLGVDIHTSGFRMSRVLKAKVLMALGDTPARAKLAGFPSHSQHGRWCGYCLSDSHGWVDALLRQEAVVPRDPEMHRNAAFIVKATPAARDESIRSHAATWTALYDLPYWRSVTDVPVDAMHVLHLGACKRFWHATLVEGNLLPAQLPIIAAVIKSATFPRGLTAIRPTFGTKKGGSPTSDAWSTFARFLLPLVLASHWSDLLDIDGHREFHLTHRSFRPPDLAPGAPTPPFRCNVAVRHLVQMGLQLSIITHIVQAKEFTEARIVLLERMIREHISSTATYIDPRWLVPNHHALTHLPAHIRRFGPPREFWFYSMERLNGFLKNTVHNEHPGGELEYSMQSKHSLFRTVRRQLATLGDSAEEKIFRKLLIDKDSQLDPFQSPDNEEEYTPDSPRFVGEEEEVLLEPSVVQAIVLMVNSTRGAADPIAVPELHHDGQMGADVRMLIGSEAIGYPHILVRATKVTPVSTRSNVAKGASNIIINSNAGPRPARLMSVFKHTYAVPRTGQLVQRSYAEVEVYQRTEWPHQHVLTSSATRLGYHLYTQTDAQPGVVPLVNIIDTFVSATARYITEDEDDMFAAALHP